MALTKFTLLVALLAAAVPAAAPRPADAAAVSRRLLGEPGGNPNGVLFTTSGFNAQVVASMGPIGNCDVDVESGK